MARRESTDETSLRERVRLLAGDRFELVRSLGAGGFGSVVEVHDHQSGARVALKILRATRAVDVFAFKREFRSLSGVKHPNLVTLYELFTHLDYWGFTMELIDGVSIATHIAPHADSPRVEQETMRVHRKTSAQRVDAPRRGVDVAALRDALSQLTRALSAMHSMGYVHRDIKPANILIERSGRLVVLDFGLVGLDARDPQEVIGTPPYMAPERLRGEDGGPAADWYAVGALLFQCLTGRVPTPGAKPPASVPDDLRQLCGALLHDDPDRRPTGAEIRALLGVSIRAPANVFVGRASELSILNRALHQESFAGVEISGVAGAGKTALCEQFLDTADALVLRTRCHPSESVPFKSLDGLMDSLAGAWFELEGRESVLPREMPYVLQAFPIFRIVTEGREPAFAEAPDAHPSYRRRMAALGIRRIVERVSAQRRLVLFVDDLHWGDRDSIRIFERILAPPTPPLLLVVAHRPESDDNLTLARTIDALRSAEPGRWTSLELGPLSREDIGALLSQSGQHLDSDALQELVAESKGNPFVVGQMLSGQSTSEDLPPLARDVLRSVCVAGRPIALQHVCPRGSRPERVVDALALLRSRRLLRAGELGDRARLDLYHARVRELVLSRLGEVELSAHHLKLAESLSASGAAPHEVARHWHSAGRTEMAAATAEAAGDQAASTLAFEQAVEMYDLARANRSSIEVSRKLAAALANAGRGGDAAREYRSIHRRSGDPDSLRLAAEHDLRSGHIERGLESLAEVLGRHGATIPPSPRQALPLLGVSIVRRTADRFVRSVGRDARGELDAHWSATVGLGLVDPVRAAPFAAEAHRLALLAGDATAIARSQLMEVGFLASVGRHERAEVALSRARRLPVVSSNPWLEGLAFAMQALVAYEQASWRETYESAQRAEAVFQRECTGVAWELRSVQLFTLSSLFFLGEVGHLRERVRESLADAEERGDRYAATNIRTQLVPSVHLSADRPDLAHAEIDAALADWSDAFTLQHNYALGTKTIVDLYEGRADRAVERLRRHRVAQLMSLMDLDHSVRTYWTFLRSTAELAAVRMGTNVPFACQRALLGARRLESKRRPAYSGWAAVLRAGVAGVGGRDPKPHLRSAVHHLATAEMALYRDAAALWLAIEERGSVDEPLDRIRSRNMLDPRAAARSILGGGVL